MYLPFEGSGDVGYGRAASGCQGNRLDRRARRHVRCKPKCGGAGTLEEGRDIHFDQCTLSPPSPSHTTNFPPKLHVHVHRFLLFISTLSSLSSPPPSCIKHVQTHTCTLYMYTSTVCTHPCALGGLTLSTGS